MLAHLEALHLVLHLAVRRDRHLNVVVEAFFCVEYQASGAAGRDVGSAVNLLFVIQGQVGGKHQVDILLLHQLHQRLAKGFRLQVVFFSVKQGRGLRLQQRVANKQDLGVTGVVGQQVPQPAYLPAPGGFAGAVEKNQPGVAGADAVEMRAEVVVEPEAAEVLVFVGPEGE